MKTLKFKEKLSKLILSGEKTTTWRLFDDKDLQVSDEVIFLVKETLQEFAKVRLLEVVETIFGNLSEEDLDGHEKYSSPEEMYKVFSEFYQRQVDANSPVKIIKFKLL